MDVRKISSICDYFFICSAGSVKKSQAIADGIVDSLKKKAPKIKLQSKKPLSQFAAKININKASAVDLESLQGIGPALAKKIIDYRQGHGKFKTIEDIKQVKGIGDSKFEKIRNQISVE